MLRLPVVIGALRVKMDMIHPLTHTEFKYRRINTDVASSICALRDGNAECIDGIMMFKEF